MAVARTRIICGDLQGELQVFQQGSEPCYRVVPDQSAKPAMHPPAGHLDNGRAFYLPSAFESMSGRRRSQNWKRSVHVLQDGVKGETLLRWLKRQGVIQLGAEWHRHLYDLPAPPKQPSKATAAQRSMPPMQEGGPRTIPAAASATGAPEGPARTAAPAAAQQEPAEQEAAQAAAAAPAAPATPTAQRQKPGPSDLAEGLVPAAKDLQQAGAMPAPGSRDGADSDSDISIGMWELPPGPPREGLPHVAVKLEEDERIADAEIKLETSSRAKPSQAVRQMDAAAAAKPEGSVSSDDLALITLRRPVPLPQKQLAFTADWQDSSRGPSHRAQSSNDASLCPSRRMQRQHVRRQSHRILDDSEEETGAARAPGLQRESPSSPQQLHLPRQQRHSGHLVGDSDEETAAARGPAGPAEPGRSPRQAQSQHGRRRLSSQVLEDSEDEAEAATAPVACPEEGRGVAVEAHEAEPQSAATLGRQLQQPPGDSGRQQEGQVEGLLRATETCSANSGEATSSGSSQQPLRARLRRRQATKQSVQHAAARTKRKAESPVAGLPNKLRQVPNNAGFQPDVVALSPPARQGSPMQADQAAHAMPASHAEVQHAADMADSAASQHTPAQGSPARTSHSLVTPVPEQDSRLREAPQAPQLGTASNQSPMRDLRQRQAELQASNDALEARASAAEAEALQLRAKLGAAQSEAALARAQLQEQLGCMRTMATASEIATATARKLLVERHTLQGRLSQVLQEKADVKAIWAGCGSRAIALKMDDLKQQLQREAAKRVAAEQQVAELTQQVKRLQAENMQSAVSALAALQHMDQKSRSQQAEVSKINRSLQAETAELVRRKGLEFTALQEQANALQAQNRDLSTALSRAWSCQKTAQAQLQARLSTIQSQGQTAEPVQAAGKRQSAAYQSAARQQDEGRLSRAIQAFEHAASRMNQKPAPLQGAVAAVVGTSMALEAPSAAEEAYKKLQADYDALLATVGICGQLFVTLGRPAVAESITAYLQGARAPFALQQR